MVLKLFQRAPAFLRESGELITAEGSATTAGAASAVAISRALCRVHFFEAVEGLSGRQFAQAARMAAEANKPFEDADWIVLRSKRGATIWYWDKARLPGEVDALAARGRLAPESVSFAPGEGWRIVRALEGYEAQYWEDGVLLASTWRRRPFTPDQWRLFVQGVRAPVFTAPDAPPADVPAGFDTSGAWRRDLIRRPLGWSDVESVAATALVCVFGLLMFFTGHALHHDMRARDDISAAAAITERMAADPQAARSNAHLQVISLYQQTMAAQDVFGVAATAFETLNGYGATPTAWSIDQERLRITLQQTPQDVNVRDLVAALEALPQIERVEPQFRGTHESLEIEAVLSTGAAP
ncbi:MAG: hypothetical protein AB7O98_07315 [Hyphomonadaceae bacterium]